ncbi:ATP-binding protein [Sedimentitalea sp.]|uniref:ATP-binding protein n=1 Tax=Sedimentitalea sp. TaxID=2048915 RepID=UPI003296BC5A
MSHPLPTPAATASDPVLSVVAPDALAPQDAASQMALWLTAAALRLDAYVQRDFPELASRHRGLGAFVAAAENLAPNLSPAAWAVQLSVYEHATRCEQRILPFARAAETLDLSDAQRLAFALTALAEEDCRIGALLAEIQGTPAPYPTTDTLAQTLTNPPPDLGAGWDLIRPLLRSGLLIATDPNANRGRQTFAPAPLAWDIARGCVNPAWPSGVKLVARNDARKIDALSYRRAFRDRLSRIPGAIAAIPNPVIVLRHIPGADAETIALALAHAVNRDLLVTPKETAADKSNRIRLDAAVLLTDAVPFRRLDLAPGEAFDLPKPEYKSGPVILSMGHAGGLSPETAERSVTIHVPFPTASERARAWRETLGTQNVKDFEQIRDRFQLPLGHIRRAARAAKAEAALAGRATIHPTDARTAIRTIGREQLDTLADFLPAKDSWNDLIVPGQTRLLLGEFAERCTHRERLAKRLDRGPSERGVRALFTGPSGTGKTLAARLLGGEIGTDVYRLNLSAVVDKYVGETEKRLDQLLARAEALDVILLLDEGDGLMAQRTDVKSANDRFANLETNFLLQRLESHAGIVVVTTNMPDGIDPAFQRRMDIVVPFPRPAAEVRLALWNLHLPKDHRVNSGELEQLAALATLTGGQISNAVRTATSLAISRHRQLCADCLKRGIDLELQKAGAMSGTALAKAEPRQMPGIGLSAFGALLKGDTS